MATLFLVGMGLGAGGLTERGREVADAASRRFVETYTALPPPIPTEWKDVVLVGREEVEGLNALVDALEHGDVALLVPGDPLSATTHTTLRMELPRRGHDVVIIHGATILAAAPGLSGLSPYKFGRCHTLVRPSGSYFPTSPLDGVIRNLRRGDHTLLLLDITPDGPMLGPEAASLVLRCLPDVDGGDMLAAREPIVVCGAGEEDAVFRASWANLAARAKPLPGTMHSLVVPGDLSAYEAEAMAALCPVLD